MARRALLLATVVVLSLAAACSAQPTGPVPIQGVQRDLDEPACADTVYREGPNARPGETSSTNVASVDDDGSPGDCHVVVIYY